MTRTRKILFCFTLLAAAGGAGLGHQATRRQRAALAAQEAEIARLDAATRERRRQLADLQRQQTEVERELVAHRQEVALAEAGSAMKLWANRIALLKQLLQETPRRGIPEFRLLTPTDWVHAVRARELDTATEIQNAFSRLGGIARQRMSKHLQEALRAYQKNSAGRLPTDIQELAPYLPAPADLEMLKRYAMIPNREGNDSDGFLIRESATAAMILSVGLDKWDMRFNPDWKPQGETPNPPDLEGEVRQKLSALTSAFENLGDFENGALDVMAQLPAMVQLVEKYSPQAEAILGEKAQFGEVLKTAVRQYVSTHDGEAPPTMAEALPYMSNADKILEAARPFMAEFRYMLDHKGQLSSDPTQLERYLKVTPADLQILLRRAKLTWDGEHVSVEFAFKSSQAP